jgi:nucleoid-associated protein YgaU
MAKPDLDAPATIRRSAPVRSFPGYLRFLVPSVLIFSISIVGAVQCYAQDQDVAEAARQERARKERENAQQQNNRQKKSKHVYTAEDLKREHILTPEDRAQVEARKNQPAPVGPQKPQDAIDANSLPANAPLGDVARRLQRQKESQKLQRSSKFHLPSVDAPVLASPKPPAQTLRPFFTIIEPTRPPVIDSFHPPVKRSPFERPRILPPAFATPRKLVPMIPTPRNPVGPSPAPVAPSVSAKMNVVIVKAGDSLWKFAAGRLGNGRRWQEIASINPGLRDPNHIEAGSEIVLPAFVSPAGTATKYTVRHGDSLWTIAQTQLHHATSWSCIAQANPAVRDANLIHEGQVLLIPASCPR